jgi:hypothetical protein
VAEAQHVDRSDKNCEALWGTMDQPAEETLFDVRM